jgi:hypothetical protein
MAFLIYTMKCAYIVFIDQAAKAIELSAGGRSLLQGREGEELDALETEGQMLQ